MSREQLAEFTRRLSMLSVDGVEGVYQTTYKESTAEDWHEVKVALQPSPQHRGHRC